MSQPKFSFGQVVYAVVSDTKEEYLPCPDCGGTKFVTVITHAETVTLDCKGCERGYLGPCGFLVKYVPSVFVVSRPIVSLETDWQESGTYEYRIPSDSGGRWSKKEHELFATEEEAAASCAQVLKEKQDIEEYRISQKQKAEKSWAWHVHYYQKQIRDAKNTIEYATLQLNAAKKHVKETANA